MPAAMPIAIVLVVCKTVAGDPVNDDPNAKWTGIENREFLIEHSMMQCKRIELPLYEVGDVGNPSAGVPPIPAGNSRAFTRQRCQMSSIFVGARWDMMNRHQSYRVWKTACPVPIVDTRTGRVLAWKMPECGNRETVECLVDTAI